MGADGDVCALCCTKSNPEKLFMCDKCLLASWKDCTVSPYMVFSVLHDVCWEGKVASNCVELGWLGWPNFEGVWKGSVWGRVRSKS